MPETARPRTFDEAALRRFLAYILDPVHATEIRIVGGMDRNGTIVKSEYKSVISGWFDDPDAVVRELRRVKGVSVYACLNPADRALLGRKNNRLGRCDHTTKGENVACLRWWFIDVDARNPPDTSATDAERADALARRDEILRENPELAAHAVWGSSGNGAFILVRLPDYPNDAEHLGLISRAMECIGAMPGGGASRHDDKTKDASRIGPVPGTLKCKGDPIPGRPWRLVTLEGAAGATLPEDPTDNPAVSPFDLAAWVAGRPGKVAVQQGMGGANGHAAGANGHAANGHSHPPWTAEPSVADRARKCVFGMRDSVAGEGGHKQLYAVAVSLVDGFGLDQAAAHAILAEWNAAKARPPEDERQLAHKLRDAFKNYPSPSLKLLNAGRDDYIAPPIYVGPGNGFIIPQPYPEDEPPAFTPPPPIDVEALKTKAAQFLGGLPEVLYRDRAFLNDLARLEKADPAEAAAIKSGLERVGGYKARAFKEAMTEPRKAAHGRGGGGAPGGDHRPPGNPFDPSDMGNAALFLAAHGDHARFVKDYGDWMVYDATRWVLDKGNMAGRWAQEVPGLIGRRAATAADDDEAEMIRAWELKTRSKDRLAALLAVAIPNATATPDAFDRDDWLFNCANGTIDLRTGAFRPHDPADFLTRITSVAYDPRARCPLWEAFVRRIMRNDPETVAYLRRIMGYAMTGDVKDHAIFICYGSGANGKTTYTSLCSYVLGDYATDLDPEIILSQASAMHPTGLTDLEGRRLVVCEETDDRRGMAEALMKRISGGNKIKARKIGQNYYEFEPTHHLFLATNHLPDIRGTDKGIWRRLKLIPFEVQFSDEAGQPPDPDMPEKLRAEAPGILNWMLAGLRDWRANGLKDCPAVQKATAAFRSESDMLGWFIEEELEQLPDRGEDSKDRTIFKALYGHYKSWAEQNGVIPLGPKKFGAQLKDKGFPTVKAGGVTYKIGLRIRVNPHLAAHEEEGPGSRRAYEAARTPAGAAREPGDDGDWLIA